VTHFFGRIAVPFIAAAELADRSASLLFDDHVPDYGDDSNENEEEEAAERSRTP